MASFVYMDQGNSHDLLPNVVTAENNKRSKKVKYNHESFKNGAIHDLLDSYGVINRNDIIKNANSPTQCKRKIEKHHSEPASSCSNSGSCSDCPSLCKAGIPGGMDAGCQSGDNERDWQNDSKEVIAVKIAEFFSDQSPIGKLSQNLHILQKYFEREQNFHIQHDFVTGRDDKESGGGVAPEIDTSPCPLLKIDETNANKTKLDKLIQHDFAMNIGSFGDSNKANLHKLIQHDVAMNIRSFADSILKLEQAKMEMYQDTERLRAEAETRRAELELKRTQIIMDTQLQIARLLSNKNQRGRANNVSQASTQNNVVVDKTCISRVRVNGQPDAQSVNPESMYLLSEPFLKEE